MTLIRARRESFDELLVTRCRRCDVAAWDEPVEEWNDRLLYYLRRMINDEHEAASAVQEVWLGTFRSMDRLRDGARLAP